MRTVFSIPSDDATFGFKGPHDKLSCWITPPVLFFFLYGYDSSLLNFRMLSSSFNFIYKIVKTVFETRKLLNLFFSASFGICVPESKLPVISLSELKSNHTSAVEFGVFHGAQVAHSLVPPLQTGPG